MDIPNIPKGNEAREATRALGGYVYQIYESALAWLELGDEELLLLEVAEDFAIVATDVLQAVQVKETKSSVTINSKDIVESINSFVDLQHKNPDFNVRLRHLTTSKITKEKSPKDRIGDTPTLKSWRNLAITGDLAPLRNILYSSKVSQKTKNHIKELSDDEFREDFLKRINFDCKETSLKNIEAFLRSQLSKRVINRGGLDSQVGNCLNKIVVTLLKKAIQSEKIERIAYKRDLEALIEQVTRVSLNASKLEDKMIEVMRGLSVTSSQTTNLVSSRLSKPKPIDEIPLPKVIATRNDQIDNIILSLTRYGICWVFGSAGVGKTTGVRIVGKNLGGNWTIINLRGLNTDQVNSVLSGVIDLLMEQRIKGLIIDDLECVFESGINDTLLYLKAATERADVLLIITSPKPSNTDFLFSSGLTSAINQKFEEFSEKDIQQILTGLNVDYKKWTRYIYLISGCGHPQLAIAAIQSMHDNAWNINELKATDCLLVGNQEVEKVRARTRERLLSELPNKARRLLERLSLKIGGFNRELVKDLAQITPTIEDGGIIFDRLIGSWVDQQESNRFSLSPLLSNFADKTLTANQQKEISFEIANSFLRIKSLNPIEANSVLISALSGKNTSAIFFICSAILNADEKDLKMIVPYFTAVIFMTTESLVYEGDPIINLTCRVAQLLLLRYEEDSQGKFQKALDRFYIESELVEDKQISTLMVVIAYAKLLFSKSENGPLQNYYNLIQKYDYLVNTSIKRMPDLLKGFALQEVQGLPVVSVMFLYQSQQIKTINGLLATFKSLDSCDQGFRQKLFKIYGDSELGIDFDMLVTGAWLSESDANSIDPSAHALVFQQLEDFAKSWGYVRLAVCCRKFRAIILDEYGNDQAQALKVLEEGLNFYDKTNSEFIRAKVKILYRAEDYQGSLELAKLLIDKCDPLNHTEQAFFGRDAAISSEKQGEYMDARRYYLYGSKGAKNCLIPSMEPMYLGLIADAALASWHAGDRVTCLSDLVTVLYELKKIEPKSSLRATHCHVTIRHVFLWIYQDATGKDMLLNDGEETKVIPGIISNPDPHPDIETQDIAPIEMTWYMLASIENECHLDLGITKNLHQYLPNGDVLEGRFFLTTSMISNALTCANIELFKATLPQVITQYAYLSESGEVLNVKNLTYRAFPELTADQKLIYMDLTERFVLCFIFMCIFLEKPNLVNLLLNFLEQSKLIKVREVFLSSLQNKSINSSSNDYGNQVALLLGRHLNTPQEFKTPSANKVYELAYLSIQFAHKVGCISAIAETTNKWVIKHWATFMQDQHFRLRYSPSHENQIECVSSKGSSSEKLINLMLVILPMLGLTDENQIRANLTSLNK